MKKIGYSCTWMHLDRLAQDKGGWGDIIGGLSVPPGRAMGT